MEIESRENVDTLVFSITGEIAGPESRLLFSKLGEQMRGRFDKIVLDIRQVEYIDSLGLGTLIDMHQLFREAGKRLILSGPSGLVSQLFWDSALQEIFEIVDPQSLPAEFL